MTEPEQIKLKKKYIVGQTAGRNKAGHNDSTRRRLRKFKGKSGGTQESKAIMIMLPSGKKKMIKKEEE